jgi:hypothetical protein
VWVECSDANPERRVGARSARRSTTSRYANLATPGTVFQIGLPPFRIDILTRITGVELAEAWPDRRETRIGDLVMRVIGRESLLANKRALGRHRDLADVELLQGTDED